MSQTTAVNPTGPSPEVQIPSLDTIRQAHERIRPWIHRTPVLTSAYFDRRFSCELFFKAENLQKIGAFKIRGATNAVFSLPESALEAGVVTHSSGNHAQALALAARNRAVKAYVVMPENAPAVKQAAVRGYGAEVLLCEPTLEAREARTEEIRARTGAILVHPFDDPLIVAGQATAAKELLEEVPDLDLLLTPVGGGGLLSGTCLAARYLSPSTEVWGAEPAGADDAARSLQEGRILPSIEPKTIADGLLTSLGEVTFAVLSRHVAGIVTVGEEAIVETMRRIWERMKTVVEPSAAVPLAALEEKRLPAAGKRVGVIFSGGNVDLGKLPF